MKLIVLLVLVVLGLLQPAASIAQTEALLLFGGQNNRIFLGCLNCNRFSSDSICNRFGDYGSRFSDKSIWNRFGDYGSRFSDSPWNRFPSNPPVIVDRSGNFYGYFSISAAYRSPQKVPAVAQFLAWAADQDDLDTIRDTLCE
jgi:hypothetical protein